MSKKTKESKKKNPLPVIVENRRSSEIPENMSLYLCSFTWQPQVFVNIENGEKQKIKMWTKGGNVSLTHELRKGRHVLAHEKVPKYIVDKEGKVLETIMVSKTRIVGKNYGFEALSSILSSIFPCSVEKAKELVKEAVDKNLAHPKFVLKSDLIPTSPDKYVGKNGWVIIADYPNSDKMQENINSALKIQGSSLRARWGLKWRLQE